MRVDGTRRVGSGRVRRRTGQDRNECGAELAVSAAAAGDRVAEWQRCVRRVCVSISATEARRRFCTSLCARDQKTIAHACAMTVHNQADYRHVYLVLFHVQFIGDNIQPHNRVAK